MLLLAQRYSRATQVIEKFEPLKLLSFTNMNRLIFTLVLTLSCASPLVAQVKNNPKPSKCTLPLDRAPELRGLRLGLPQAAVLARFPGVSIEKPDKLGVTQLRLNVIDTTLISRNLPIRDKAVQPDMTLGDDTSFTVDSAKFPALKDVRRIQFRFIDGRLSYLRVSYDDSIKWNSVDEFVETVAKALNLPADWSLPPDADGSNQGRELRCEGFVITADVGADSTDTRIAAQLSLQDLGAAKIVEKRQNDLKKKAQEAEDAKTKKF